MNPTHRGIGPVHATPNIFAPASTPADLIHHLSLFVLAICGAIFLVVVRPSAVLGGEVPAAGRRRRPRAAAGLRQQPGGAGVDGHPGSHRRGAVPGDGASDPRSRGRAVPPDAIEVTVIGHQFWWEFRYPEHGVVTANELHVPVSDAESSDADAHHAALGRHGSQLLGAATGRQDRPDSEPHRTACGSIRTRPGVYLGQCAQYCGTQHAKMLLRVVVEPREDFERWVGSQQTAGARRPTRVAQGRQRLRDHGLRQLPHRVGHRCATARFGPDLTHLMSRETIARRRRAEHAGEPARVDHESGHLQAGLADAGHEADRATTWTPSPRTW